MIRCDVNVPLDGKKITDDTRIRSSVPTIEFLKSKGLPEPTWVDPTLPPDIAKALEDAKEKEE